MPRFVSPNGFWIASHNHDGVGTDGVANIKDARDSHGYASRMAELRHTIYHEIADEFGEPCTILPNSYGIEGLPNKLEKLG